ncbi:hypothetical protein NQD34_004064, partial [Periophthalmus magnuspinnatus]
MANAYKMTNRDIQQLILLRASNAAIFTGRKNSAMRGWRAIKRELGLQGLMSARQLKKKWDNLNQKYKASVIKNPSEGEQPKNPAAWPWFYLMDDALNGRLDNAAKVIELLPIDDEKHEADFPYGPSSDSEDVISALNVVEMAPIESEEDIEMIDKSGNYEESTKKPNEIALQAPKITFLEYKREKKALEKEQAEFDKELINLEREREQLNKERQALDLKKIENERDRAVLDKNRADLEREKAGVERDKVLLDRDRAYLDRDRAIFERDKIFLDKAKEDFEKQKETFRNQMATSASEVEQERKCGATTEEEEQM